MKRLLILALAFVLTGCGALGPIATPTAGPTSTPVVQTVVVTVIPTQEPTEVPTETPAPTQTPQVIVITATQSAASAAPTEGILPVTGGGTATATLPAGAGGNLFTSLSRSSSYFNLRCLPQDITFSVSTSNYAATEVALYYRIEDLTTNTIWNSVR